MKIFEKREYISGDIGDRGILIGYIKAENIEEAKKILNITHNFIQLKEISNSEYFLRKRRLQKKLKMYNLLF